MINKQDNITINETTKVRNLRYNPSRADNTVNIYISTNISEVSPLDLNETTPRVRLFGLHKKAIRFQLRNTKR